MAKIVETTLRINEDNAKTYCSKDALSLGGYYAFELYMDGTTTGWAILNDTGKDILFPTSTARPHRIDSKISASRSAGTTHVTLELDDVAAHDYKVTSITQKENNLENITQVNNNNLQDYFNFSNKIAWQLDTSSTVNTCRVDWVDLKLYFNQYDTFGYIANRANGVESVAFSTNHPYHGDIVTATATLVDGAKWYGWYADPEHTVLLTSEQTISWEAEGDLTAYAYASLPTNFYFKKDSKQYNTIDIFQKISGVWVPIEKNDILNSNNRYIMN